MKTFQRLGIGLVILWITGSVVRVGWSQSLPPGAAWYYKLINGSTFLDDCPVCDRVSIPVPMRGTFQLRLIQQGPLFFTYSLEELAFTAFGNGRSYKVTGKGTFQIGGEVATQQMLTLQLSIDDGVTNQLCFFTNASSLVTRLWPMIQASVAQTNGTFTRQFDLEIDAAPFREIWFSTKQSFQAGIWNTPTNLVGGGDLLSSLGHEVKKNGDLVVNMGIQPGNDLGLKDITVLPGGNIAFSIEQPAVSSTLGTLHPGDVLSDQGRVLRTNFSLVSAFMPSAPLPPDLGLGALKIMDSGEVWFSTQTNFFSKTLGRQLQPGDLLSNKGTLVRSNAQLLALFNLGNPTNDYGLNSIYVWPSGETWFSTDKGFFNSVSNYYSPGDLLSDQGYLVYSNAELTGVFAPSNAPAELGLDALYLISDVTAASAPPHLVMPSVTNSPPLSLVFQFQDSGHAWQLERAATLDGPFLPVSPITTANPLIDVGVLGSQTQGFYRLQQW